MLLLIPIVLNTEKFNDIPNDIETDITPDETERNNYVILEELNRPYKDLTISSADMVVAWKWEYLTQYERYLSIEIDGENYIRIGEEIREDIIGDKLGIYEAVGYNYPYETPEEGYREQFEAYEIYKISPKCMVALKMDGRYYCYISDSERLLIRNAVWGDLFSQYDLSDSINLGAFAEYKDGCEINYFMLKDDSYIWEVLSNCKEAEAVNPSEWEKEGNYYSFTVTSDVYGIYKKVLYITEGGYVWTNMFDVEYICNIGEEAAQKITAYIKENSEKTEREPYRKTIVGTVASITNDYILIDDSVLCKEQNDGIIFKILLNDLRINRHVNDNRINIGDLVEIVYKNTIDIEGGYVIDSAIDANKVMIISENGIAME